MQFLSEGTKNKYLSSLKKSKQSIPIYGQNQASPQLRVSDEPLRMPAAPKDMTQASVEAHVTIHELFGHTL